MLQVLENIRSDDAAVQSMFNSGDGFPVRNRLNRDPRYKMKLAEAAKFVAALVNGRIPGYRFQEVMTTSDFPILFGDILDRSLLASYQEWPVMWTAYAKRVTVGDFRQAKIYPPTWGADGVLEEVPQATEYPDARIYEQTPILWNVTKYGRTVPFTWESMINDDLDMLKDIPVRLGQAARRTEQDLVSRLFIDANGPHASLYTSGNKNIINTANGASDDNPPLTIEGLQDAYTVLSKMVGENGQPILRDMLTLVVPPALEVQARNILNATEIHATRMRAGGFPGADTDGQQMLVFANWMRNRLTLVVDPYIPMIATTNGNTTWFLFSNPTTSREAIRIGFLRGHENPEIWLKSPNAVRVGGGAVNPMDGDFDTDSITYRVRHVTGVARIDPKATVASNGTSA